jgi:hypothetical protein
MQRVFIVEHHTAPRFYLTCHNEFRNSFPDFSVPIKSTISFLVNHFCDREFQVRNSSVRHSALTEDRMTSIKLRTHSTKITRQLYLQNGLSKESVHKATKISELHSYHAISCTNSINLLRKNDFSIADG